MRRLILAVLLALPSAARAGKRYGTFLLDSTDMSTTLGDPQGMLSSARAYFEVTYPRGGALVQDFRDGSFEGEYYLDEKGFLRARADTLLILDENYGRVCATLGVDYAEGREHVYVNTRMFRRGVPHQMPNAGAAPKAGFPESFALVRALKTSSRFLVAAGDYSLDGTLTAFRVAESSGEWISITENGPVNSTAAARAGLPLTIDPMAFAEDPFKGLPEPASPVVQDAALIYRGHAEAVERIIKRGSRLERAVLWFPPSATERLLIKRERDFPFTAGPNR